MEVCVCAGHDSIELSIPRERYETVNRINKFDLCVKMLGVNR